MNVPLFLGGIFMFWTWRYDVYADDGILKLRTLPWYHSMRIELQCTINPTICTGANDILDRTIFKKDASNYCIVEKKTSCREKPPGDLEMPPGKCWCVKDAQSTSPIYIYRFAADHTLHNGDWSCETICYFNNSSKPSKLKINNDAGLNKIVVGYPTPVFGKCDPMFSVQVVKEPNRLEASCLCQDNRKFPDCRECDFGDCTNGCNCYGLITLLTILVGVALIVATIIISFILIAPLCDTSIQEKEMEDDRKGKYRTSLNAHKEDDGNYHADHYNKIKKPERPISYYDKPEEDAMSASGVDSEVDTSTTDKFE